MKSPLWTYMFQAPGGTPSQKMIQSDWYVIIDTTSVPVHLKGRCSNNYNYIVEVTYPKPGTYRAKLISEGNIFVLDIQVKSGLIPIYNAKSEVLSLNERFHVFWKASDIQNIVSYQLEASETNRTWLVDYSSYVLRKTSCFNSRRSNSLLLTDIVLQKTAFLGNFSGAIRFSSGTAELTLNTTYTKLTFDLQTNRTVLYFFSNSDDFSYYKQDSRVNNVLHIIFIQQQIFLHLIKFCFSWDQRYTVSVQTYVNKRDSLYKSVGEFGSGFDLYLYNSPAPHLDFTQHAVWFVPTQHPLLQCEWTFKLQVLCASRTSLTSTYSYSDQHPNALTFLSGAEPSWAAVNYVGFVANVTCFDSGEKPLILTVTFGNRPVKIARSLACFSRKTSGCLKVLLRKPDPPVIPVKKSLQFTVYSSVAVYCSCVLQTTFIWKIYRVAGVSSVPKWENPLAAPFISSASKSFLYIPKCSLEYGMYMMNLTVSVFIQNSNLNVTNTDSLFVDVMKSPLKAVIKGGSYRTVGFNATLVLNGSLSADPDVMNPFDGLHFSWYCSRKPMDLEAMTLSPNNACHPDQFEIRWPPSSKATVEIMPELLKGGAVYHFRLSVQKDGRESHFNQAINVLPGPQPEIQLYCIENCDQLLNPSNRFVLSCACISCSTDSQPNVEWYLLAGKNATEIAIDWAANTTTGRFNKYLSINAFVFQKSIGSTFELQVKVSTRSGLSSMQRYFFSVNEPPKMGNCQVIPSNGIALLTEFVVQCSGFVDDNHPLMYKVKACVDDSKRVIVNSLQDNSCGTIVYLGYSSTSQPFLLPPGIASEDNMVTLYVHVSDQLGAYTLKVLQVKVKYSLGFSMAAKLGEIEKGPLAASIAGEDYMKTNQLIFSIASILNAPDYAIGLAKKTELRESLLKTASSIPVHSFVDVSQVASSINKITEVSSDINKNIGELAVGKLMEITFAFLKYATQDIGTEITENVGGAILSAVSNVVDGFTVSNALSTAEVTYKISSTKDIFTVLQSLSDGILEGKVPGENVTVLQSKMLNISNTKSEQSNIMNSFIGDSHCSSCFKPRLPANSAFSPDATLSVSIYTFVEDPYPWLLSGDNVSTVVSAFQVHVLRGDGNTTDLVIENFEMVMQNKYSPQLLPIVLEKDKSRGLSGAISFDIMPDPDAVLIIQLFPEFNVSFSVNIHLCDEDLHSKPFATYLLPHNNTRTLVQHDQRSNTSIHFVEHQEPYVVQIPQALPILENTMCKVSIFIKTAEQSMMTEMLNVSVLSAFCLDFDGWSNSWKKHTCKVGALTNKDRVHCICSTVATTKSKSEQITFLRSIFGKIIVIPNVVDLRKIGSLFGTIHRNWITLITVCIIYAAYGCLAVWASKKAKSDVSNKDQVMVLPDNDPFDKYCYLLTVYTGSRVGAGTSADVFCELTGSCGKSSTHLLKCSLYTALQRDDVDTFLLSTETDLGDIESVRFWHNNAGLSPEWYLSRVKVENLYNKQTWYFLCRRWFAINKGDGNLDHTFTVSDREAAVRRHDVFEILLSIYLKDNSLWFSIFAQVIRSKFTRLQRLSCCLAMLMSSLVTSIVLFKKERYTGYSELQLLQSVMVGIESSLVTVPVHLLLSSLFKYAEKDESAPIYSPFHCVAEYLAEMSGEARSINKWIVSNAVSQPRNWRQRLQRWHTSEGIADLDNVKTVQSSDSRSVKSSSMNTNTSGFPTELTTASNCVLPSHITDSIFEEDEDDRSFNPKKRSKQTVHRKINTPPSKEAVEKDSKVRKLQRRFKTVAKNSDASLSFWCSCAAWCLTIICTGVSGFFIVVYGLSYGPDMSLKWFVASVVSMAQSILILQPLKVALLSALFSFWPRCCKDLPWPSSCTVREIDIDQVPETAEDMRDMHYELTTVRNSRKYQPLKEDEIQVMRRRDVVKIKAFTFCRGICSHFIFLFLVFQVTYTNKNTAAFFYNTLIKKTFSEGISQVDNINSFYTWVNNIYLPLLQSPHQSLFRAEINSFIVGLPRMRQIRANQTEFFSANHYTTFYEAVVTKVSHHPKYGKDQEDKKNYSYSWEILDNETAVENISRHSGWVYEKDSFPWNYYSHGEQQVYAKGGYTVYFFPSLSLNNSLEKLLHLKTNNWFDYWTSAVILELTIFNPDAGLFCPISIIFEWNPAGGITGSVRVTSFEMLSLEHLTGARTVSIATLTVFLIVYTVDECLTIIWEKGRYIKKITNHINLILNCVLLTAVSFYMYKIRLSSDMLHFYTVNKQSFIPFHVLASLDKALKTTLGLLAFFSILKTLRYASCLYSVRLAQRSIQIALSGVCSMALVAILFFFIYMAFGYLVFGQYDWNFCSFNNAAQTVMSYCVLSFQNTEFANQMFLGGLYLTSFMVVMICILINLFQAVLILAFKEMRNPVYEDPSEEAEVVSFLSKKLLRMWHSLWGRVIEEEEENQMLNIALYGQPNRAHTEKPTGLKTKTLKGKKVLYLQM
nr:PREDICTED: polycystic kidney disease and receptor for egg jelly-related protein isoform X2 [Lepisosteus oculatus]